MSPVRFWFLGTTEKDLINDVKIRVNLGRYNFYMILPAGLKAGGHFPLSVDLDGDVSSIYNTICSMFASDYNTPPAAGKTIQLPVYQSVATQDDNYKYTVTLSKGSGGAILDIVPAGFGILRSAAGQNDYSKMSRGITADANEEFYLAYGFMKTYWVYTGSLDGEPTITLSTPSSSAPYLRYALTKKENNLYRLDLWVDRYESPLGYNSSALPYSATDEDGFDALSGDKSVTITASLTAGTTTYSHSIICKVLHKRFAVDLSVKSSDLVLSMWNPLQLYMNYTIKGFVNYSYWKTPHNVLWYIPEDKEYNFKKDISGSSGTIIPGTAGKIINGYFATNFLCENFTHGHVEGSWNPKKGSYDIGQGTDWSYFRFPYVEDCGSLILTYKKGKVYSSYINFQRSCFGVSNEFKSASPGLSCSLSNFNIDNFISVPANIDYQPLWSGKAEWFVQSGSTGWFGILTPKSYDVLYEGIYYIRSTKYIGLLESSESSTGRAAAAAMKELGLNAKEWQFWDDEYGPKPIIETSHQQNNPVISY